MVRNEKIIRHSIHLLQLTQKVQETDHQRTDRPWGRHRSLLTHIRSLTTMTSGYSPDTVLAISLYQRWGKSLLCIGYNSLGETPEPHRDEHLLKPMAGLGQSSPMP